MHSPDFWDWFDGTACPPGGRPPKDLGYLGRFNRRICRRDRGGAPLWGVPVRLVASRAASRFYSAAWILAQSGGQCRVQASANSSTLAPNRAKPDGPVGRP
jgi:hypothetical protein